MRATRVFSPEEDARIHEMRARGTTWIRISIDMDIDERDIIERGQALGLTKPKVRHPKEQPHHAAQVRAMLAAGVPKTAIAAETGLSMDRIYTICRREGLMAKPKPRAKPEPRKVNGREVYRAGHPIPWGLMTAGTVLEGTVYPCP